MRGTITHPKILNTNESGCKKVNKLRYLIRKIGSNIKRNHGL
jgi:hypothetical protein